MIGRVRDLRWAWGFPALPVALGALGDIWYPGLRVSHDFVVTVCQVVPVLILGLALETRLLSIRDTEDRELQATTLGVAWFLGLGEMLPLVGILVGRDWLMFAAPGLAAVVLGLGFILAVAVLEPVHRRQAQRHVAISGAAERVRRAVATPPVPAGRDR